MRRTSVPTLAILFLLIVPLLPAALSAQPAQPAAEHVDAVVTTVETPLSEEGRFAVAVNRSRDAFNAELARLTESFANAGTADQAVAIQREISVLKQDWEIELMEIQLQFAREAGRLEQATEIESVIAQARAAVAAASADAGR